MFDRLLSRFVRFCRGLEVLSFEREAMLDDLECPRIWSAGTFVVRPPAGKTFGETQFLFCLASISNLVILLRKPTSSSEQEFRGDFLGGTGGFRSRWLSRTSENEKDIGAIDILELGKTDFSCFASAG